MISDKNTSHILLIFKHNDVFNAKLFSLQTFRLEDNSFYKQE